MQSIYSETDAVPVPRPYGSYDETQVRQAFAHAIPPQTVFEGIVGSCEPMRQVRKKVAKVPPSDSTVIILDETGTGNELIARALQGTNRPISLEATR
jgi:transcriptional regulator with GAF, ATPase, and Fis domain